jgi:hypothetical protein
MKSKTTNLASAAMLVVLSPVLALALLVSVKTAGIKGNEVLLLLLTLFSAVLSGINGFGRRTGKAVRLHSAGGGSSDGGHNHRRIHWSTRTRTNA